MVQLSHAYMTTGKTIVLTRCTFVGKAMSLLFNTLSRFVIDFLPSSKRLLTLWLQSLSMWFWSPRKWSLSLLPFFPHLFAMKWWTGSHDLSFSECWVLSQLFHSPLSPSSRGSLVPLRFLPLEWCHLHIWGGWYLSQKSWFQLGILHDVLCARLPWWLRW